MGEYFLRRLVRIALVWLGISLITFFLLRLTGDPARNVLGELATQEAVEQYRRQEGLDRPLPEQYLKFVSGAIVGDFGRSLRYQQPILPIILERLPATLELAAASLFISFAVGVPLGIIAALKKDKAIDFFARGLVLLAQGIPNFFLAILLILLFGVTLRWLPTGGRGTLQHLILPALVLSFILLPLTVRVTRAAILDVMNQNYVRMARAKGMRENSILLNHMVRNASLPILTILGVHNTKNVSAPDGRVLIAVRAFGYHPAQLPGEAIGLKVVHGRRGLMAGEVTAWDAAPPGAALP